MTEVRTIEDIVSELGKAYKGWKGNESKKNTLRDEFFEAITRKLTDDSLAERVIEVEAPSKEDAVRLVTQRYPTWTIPDSDDGIRQHPEKEAAWEIILRENPEYISYSITVDDKVYGRQVSTGSPMIDDERLQAENPELWLGISRWPNQKFIEELLYNAGVDGHKLDGSYNEDEPDDHTPYMDQEWVRDVAGQFGIKRQLRPLDQLEPELLDQLQDYIYPAKPQVKLPAPKPRRDG